jgi:hypothetical protein
MKTETPIEYLSHEIRTNWKLKKVYVKEYDMYSQKNFCAEKKEFYKYIEKEAMCYSKYQLDHYGMPFPNQVPYLKPEYIHNDYDFEIAVDELGVFEDIKWEDDYGNTNLRFNGSRYLVLGTEDGGLDDEDIVRKGNKPLFWAITIDTKGVVELATFEYNPATYDIEVGWHMRSEALHPKAVKDNDVFGHYGWKRASYFNTERKIVSLSTTQTNYDRWNPSMRMPMPEFTESGERINYLSGCRVHVDVNTVKKRYENHNPISALN